jgi:hypothetical protein
MRREGLYLHGWRGRRITLSRREREGPIAQQWEGEGLRRIEVVLKYRTPQPPTPLRVAGPSFSPWEKVNPPPGRTEPRAGARANPPTLEGMNVE